MSRPMQEPVRQCEACGKRLPSQQDPSDDLCDGCGLARAEMDDEDATSDAFPMPDSPPSPGQLLTWLDDVIEGAWVDDMGRRVLVRDVKDGAAYLDVVPPEGWLSTAQVRYRITIEPGEVQT